MTILPVYVSGYTRQNGKGIYSYLFDTDTGLLTNQQLVANSEAPSFITIHRESGQLIAVNETNEYQGRQGTGYVSAYARDPSSGALQLLNTQSSEGADPCYVTVVRDYCLVSNYTGGSVVAFPLSHDGLKPASSVMDLGKSGIQATQARPDRQEAPHAHAVDVDPIEQALAIVMDLGSDRAIVIPYHHGELKQPLQSFKFPDGAGPRHMVFAPNMRSFCYVLGELDNKVYMLELNLRNDDDQRFHLIQQISALPPDVVSSSDMLGAEIKITPNGKFLYATIRGHDSISAFYIDDRNGKLTLIDNQSTRGQHPRYFVIDPTGHYLLLANQFSNNIVTFKIDQDSGKLSHIQTIDHPEATCIQFWL
ncbi:Lactonase, 7-bladed beta-propeller-domain-containing protein [Halteromyces radiatus]|uniref:Lactonase, 7-bladed beta-propeller-domain-containing protein n=1 Tax=Halteromyces radiatus TaxID=101107 RepID=UPI0022207CD4|nr:Lactonase, 7-bladed beta-propeller-domain-containing protein [Halteromyces radiatus]KAI8081702.1 Lactonase, 7-bladed beta-propeller-domain-containing protein [Halteromyces radiatus]